ncbi:hypothetical protein J1781_02210 [Rahnella sp. C60]|uniref:hypothetical protein n=1 Tax=Rahnella perminowiae TaxID=2816244 RepID=UPI001C279899|nr:hypothetical protein [Rahnella perminowiae]MBU9809136.1 hypothetical protein [Rahnella perminowiae]MBU9813669.1 hypothetical protein [Rahnella perminowiae]MCR9000666.1 hypothetical protein [Rahnella perminowiae]
MHDEYAVLNDDGAVIGIGYSLSNGVYLPPAVPEGTTQEIINDADLMKELVLSNINKITQIWQTQLALNLISDDDRN